MKTTRYEDMTTGQLRHMERVLRRRLDDAGEALAYDPDRYVPARDAHDDVAWELAQRIKTSHARRAAALRGE